MQSMTPHEYKVLLDAQAVATNLSRTTALRDVALPVATGIEELIDAAESLKAEEEAVAPF